MRRTPLTHNSDIVTGGWWQSGIGVVVSTWSWLAGDATGLTIILTVSTIILTVIKIVDAVRRWNMATGGLRERWKAVTRPVELD